MGWRKVGKPVVKRVTHELAQQYAEMESIPGQRDIRESRKRFIYQQVAAAVFRTCEWAIIHCLEDGKTYLANGHHTSRVFAGLNGELPNDLYVTLTEYEADTRADMADCYATFDSPDGVRSTRDITQSYAAFVPEAAELPGAIKSLAVAGMAIATWGLEYSKGRIRRETRSKLIPQNPKFAKWLYGIIGTRCEKNKHMHKAPIVAAMFATWLKESRKATEFWTLVLDGAGTDTDAPDRKLNKYLLSITMQSAGVARGHVNTSHKVLYLCLTAWMAWRKGGSTEMKYYASAALPLGLPLMKLPSPATKRELVEA